jgi:endonuclease/exonuclease/phosphatase family metal-dependent hydrolase
VVTWNVFHGRAVPSAGHELFEEFDQLIAGWEWDVALLQELPPWWPEPLSRRSGASERHVLTSRNSLLALRRAVAVRRPDLIRSNGGGCIAILVRGREISEHRRHLLGRWPERRWMHAVRLSTGEWVGNLHTGPDARQGVGAATLLTRWAAGAPMILGGDFNVREPQLPGLTRAGGHGVDQVYAGNGLSGAMTAVLDRGRLSDHAPVLVSVVENSPPWG